MIAIAARTPSWLSALEKDYAARIVGFALHCRAVKPSSPTKEAAAVSAARPKRSRLFCLDADGVARDSAMFADFLQKELQGAHSPVFVVGGADGLPPPLRESADGLVSLSPLTFAHATARLLLAEQLYRADCLMRNHPYPR